MHTDVTTGGLSVRDTFSFIDPDGLPSVSIKSDELDLLTNYRRLNTTDKLEINEFIKLKISIKESEELNK